MRSQCLAESAPDEGRSRALQAEHGDQPLRQLKLFAFISADQGQGRVALAGVVKWQPINEKNYQKQRKGFGPEWCSKNDQKQRKGFGPEW
jgi:hypothetical protein